MDTTAYLEDLETRIDPSVEAALLADWRQFCDGGFRGDLFAPRRAAASPPGVTWPAVRVNEALEDFDKMLIQQLAGCSHLLASGSGMLLDVRCNYGSSILPSLFGVSMFIMDDQYNTLPTSCPLEGGTDGIRRLLDRGMPDLSAGYGARVFEMGQRFIDALRPYPNLRRTVTIFHPDTQGPMDVCEVLWGSGIFLELVDEPDLVHRLLTLVTDTYLAFHRRWRELVPCPANGFDTHWQMMHRGHVMLRDDSAMNLSPEMFSEFILPYNGRILDAVGGGADHFCGRGDHYIDRLTSLPGLYAINLSQPEYNDMEVIYRATVDKGIPLLGLSRPAAESALASGRDLRGLVHCR